MRPDDLYLRDILSAASAIERFLEGVEERQLARDEVLQSAVLHKLTVIGEAAARVSRTLRDTHPEIEWKTIVGLRNVLVHEYFSISWGTVWVTAREEVPALARLVEAILDERRG